VPIRMSAGVAAAVCSPTLDTVNTAPRAVLDNLHVVNRRVAFQVFAIVSELSKLVGLDVVKSGGECHFAESVMMAISLAVGSDVHQLGPWPQLLSKAGHQSFGECFTVSQ